MAEGETTAFGPIVFSDGINADCQPTMRGTIFPEGIQRVYACFEFEGMSDGMSWTYTWYQDGKELSTETSNWQWGESGSFFLYYDGLPRGNYELRLYIEGTLRRSASLAVGGLNIQDMELSKNCKSLSSGAVVMCYPEEDPMRIVILCPPERPGEEPKPMFFYHITDLQLHIRHLRRAVQEHGEGEEHLAGFEEAYRFAKEILAAKHMARAA